MESLIYVYRASIRNSMKRSLKKPVTYIYMVLAGCYLAGMLFTMPEMITDMGLDNPKGLVVILSFFTLMTVPMNLLSYAKKRGLVFKNSDVQFVFTSPAAPKLVLLYGQIRQYIMGFVFSLLLAFAGVFWFHVSAWIMVAYFVLAFAVENVLEASMMVLIYGNEGDGEKTAKVIRWSVIGILGILVLFGLYLFYSENASFNIVSLFLNHPFLQMVPLAGWNIAFIRLLLLGPTALNVACTVLYCITAFVLGVLAWKMKCTGAYYEDAMSFAEDYTNVLEKSRKGEAVFLFGKKKKYRKADIVYKGSYAKAIFYRQLLEYKKNRFFIFSPFSLVCLGAGCAIAFFASRNAVDLYGIFVIPGVSAYIAVLFSGYPTKWEKELMNPYTYLIPDTAMKKLWYATLVEHIRAFVDGCLIAVPAGIFLGLNAFQILLCIFIHVSIQANRLYLVVFVEAFLGKVLPMLFKRFTKIFLQMFFMGISIAAAVIGTLLINVEAGFILAILMSGAGTLIAALGASVLFERMESIE